MHKATRGGGRHPGLLGRALHEGAERDGWEAAKDTSYLAEQSEKWRKKTTERHLIDHGRQRELASRPEREVKGQERRETLVCLQHAKGECASKRQLGRSVSDGQGVANEREQGPSRKHARR